MRIVPQTGKRRMIRAIVLTIIVWAATLSAQQSPHGTLTIPCASCHTTESWKMSPASLFSHATTRFPLEGRHSTLECKACHTTLRFAGTSMLCTSCHSDIHRGELGATCTKCHTAQNWNVPDIRQRHQQTRFPLTGRHASADCRSCHSGSAGKQYAGTPVACIECHRNDYVSAVNPNHRTAGFSTRCTDCHSVSASSWGTGFSHELTRFALTGSHRAVACVDCHTQNRFRGTPMTCISCHQTVYERAVSVNHQAAGFGTNCETCHSTAQWTDGQFDHAATPFALSGAHRSAACRSCHGDNVYKNKSALCYSCHQKEYAQSANPNHTAAQLPTICIDCHSTTAWTPSTFNHATTRFALTGKHTTAACASCHTNGNYQLAYSGCYSCHRSSYDQTVNPNHAQLSFPQTCDNCHSTGGWKPASFDHNTTAFPLTGRHAATSCASCHTSGNYQLTYSGCYACHQSQYQSAPGHATQGYPQLCQSCHGTSAWKPSTFNHDAAYFRIYSGEHRDKWQTCGNCHDAPADFSVFTCINCHEHANKTNVDDKHKKVTGYTYTRTSCYSCHRSI